MENRNKKPALIETLVQYKENQSVYSPPKKQEPDKDYQSGARIIELPSSQLPPNVLGMYDPISHTIYIANDIPEYQEKFVRKHESGHALGITDEMKTDHYALSQVGYNLRCPGNKLFRWAA